MADVLSSILLSTKVDSDRFGSSSALLRNPTIETSSNEDRNKTAARSLLGKCRDSFLKQSTDNSTAEPEALGSGVPEEDGPVERLLPIGFHCLADTVPFDDSAIALSVLVSQHELPRYRRG